MAANLATVAELAFPERREVFLTWLPQGTEHLSATALAQKLGRTIQMNDFPRYKYLMYLDGNTASDRLRYLLAFDSVVIKHESPYYEFYYPFLKPFEHYVPVQADFSDLISTLEQLDSDDAYCRAVAQNGRDFVARHLTYPSVMRYIKEVLEAYQERGGGL